MFTHDLHRHPDSVVSLQQADPAVQRFVGAINVIIDRYKKGQMPEAEQVAQYEKIYLASPSYQILKQLGVPIPVPVDAQTYIDEEFINRAQSGLKVVVNLTVSYREKQASAREYAAREEQRAEEAASSHAIGTITFYTGSPVAVFSVTIPSGTIMQTSRGIQFVTTSNVLLKAGSAGVEAPIRALAGGPMGNVPANSITELVVSLGYPLLVKNLKETTGGAEAACKPTCWTPPPPPNPAADLNNLIQKDLTR